MSKKIIDITKLFKRLCQLEYDLLIYINKKQGSDAAPLNFDEAAKALNVDKAAVRNAVKRLNLAGILVAMGDSFKIHEEIYKEPEIK